MTMGNYPATCIIERILNAEIAERRYMPNNKFDLTGKTALITGAGRGIGREIARTFAHAGADIIVAEYIAENGQRTVAEIKGMGRNALFIEVDVRHPDSVNTMVATALEHFPQIDILVNNAGIAQRTKAEESSDDDWLNMMNVNLNGVFWCCRAVGKHMLERGQGSIVSIASMSGMIVNKPQEQTAYNVSKAGVIMMTKSLGAEWASRGVRVNCVSPGYIGTEMTQEGLSDPELKETWLEMTPMGRVGEPQDIANAVLYLASDEAKFATGTNLVVDGGYTAW
jgi:NAD(P)-dependent dehydrogenase (short-subunit alcohol dehydrogenase family)